MSPISYSHAPLRPLERLMVFVDGGYLRALSKQFFEHDRINFGRLVVVFTQMFNTISDNPFNANLIRIYYYDAIVEVDHPEYKVQRKYFDRIMAMTQHITVRLGRLVESPKEGFRQKGVDILMSVDALTKADHYETGMFVMGDRDFIPLIEAVKNVGKKTIIVYCPPIPIDLKNAFDWRISFDEKGLKDWLE
ncbi:MAG: NYN domain-containing protein [Candidatus Hodarchaeota archaeon]